jgi:hypothetical protein
MQKNVVTFLQLDVWDHPLPRNERLFTKNGEILCSANTARSPSFVDHDYPREDLSHLLLLQLPVRCRNCHHRAYANIFYARTLPAPKMGLTKTGGPTSKPSGA